MDISLSYGRRAQGDAASGGVGEYFRAQPALQHGHADESEDDQQCHDGQGELLAAGDGKGHGGERCLPRIDYVGLEATPMRPQIMGWVEPQVRFRRL